MIPARRVLSSVMNCWHQSDILSLWTEEKGGSAGRGLYHERSKEVNCFKYTTWILAMQWSWALMSIRMNQSFHGGPSLPARQEDSK